MPRIDPIQLLKCLTVLLSPSGGIRSKDEVARLASLMNKFSKKLVSKCIYIQILKATETNLLGLFMGAGGWDLAYTWLTDSIEAMNWPLAQELLELLLLCPVDVDRLKTNTCPKRVKELSKDNTRPVIRTLAGKLVEQWLKIVKGEFCEPLRMTNITQLLNQCSNDVTNDAKPYMQPQDVKVEDTKDNLDLKMEAMYDAEVKVKTEEPSTVVDDIKMPIDIVSVSENKEHVQLSVKIKVDENSDTETLPILKISMKNGKQIISKVEDTTIERKRTHEENNDSSNNPKEKEPKSSSSKHKEKGRTHNLSKSSSSRGSDRNSSKSSSDGQSSKSSSDDPSSKSSSDGRSSKYSSEKQKSGSSASGTKSRDKSKEDKNRSSSSHRNKESDRHKDRKSSDKSKSSKDKHESSKSSSSRSKSEKSRKEKDDSAKVKDPNEKSKETLEKLQPPSIHKLGKIPRKSDSLSKKDGPSFSIEIRKPEDPKPKTIKMFNSKFRSHGLEEEARPPPSRTAVLKKPTQPVPSVMPVPKLVSPIANALHKRSSPNRHSLDTPPEKKLKLLEHTDKPGAIKLIPPKPKPILLLESDMFMDALTASASTNKKDPKKRKRRASESKDGNPTATETSAGAPNDASSPISSPLTSPVRSEPKSAPLRFYQDTLETEEDKVKDRENVKEGIRRSPVPTEESPSSPIPTDNPTENLTDEMPEKPTEKSLDKSTADTPESDTPTRTDSKEGNRIPGGILTYHKKKGPKKTLRWRTADELEEIQYFELDENERVNVTKTFIDMKNLERVHERESFQKSRNFHDIMEEKMNYRPLIPISIDAAPIEYGKNSREKDVQTAREKTVLQSLYFHKSQIPDSPAEPDVEVHSTTDPIIIPLEDVTGSLESTNDFRNTPWPEPKGLPPTNDLTPPQMFPPFGSGFPNQPFGMPGFQGMGPGNMPPMSGPMGPMPPGVMPMGAMPPGVMPPGAMPPGVMPPGAMPPGAMPPGAMPPGAMPPGPMPPGMISDLMAQGGMTDMFGNQIFPNCPMPNGDAFNMGDNMNGPTMFPQRFSINGPQGPNNSNGPPGNNFFYNGNRGGPRGGSRGSAPWRGKGPSTSGRWDGPTSRGRGGRVNKVCMHFSKKGSCKSGDKCAFMHPGVNCPY